MLCQDGLCVGLMAELDLLVVEEIDVLWDEGVIEGIEVDGCLAFVCGMVMEGGGRGSESVGRLIATCHAYGVTEKHHMTLTQPLT